MAGVFCDLVYHCGLFEENEASTDNNKDKTEENEFEQHDIYFISFFTLATMCLALMPAASKFS